MQKAKIWKGNFSIIKAKKPMKGAFASIDDGNETTVIIDEKKAENQSAIKSEKGYRLITFDMVMPFGMVGFISKISSALANAKIPIFVISGYSTDHMLVKGKHIKRAAAVLKKLGFEVI